MNRVSIWLRWLRVKLWAWRQLVEKANRHKPEDRGIW